jgi:hypothetical protein
LTVTDGGDKYVAIQETSTGAWTAYEFDSGAGSFTALMTFSSTIGTVTNSSSLDLPELGSWWDYCLANNIIPEFPALSSVSTYYTFNYHSGENAVVKKVDHNAMLDSTYYYSWFAFDGTKTVRDMFYDKNNDKVDELIASWIYSGVFDYSLSDMASWQTYATLSSYDLDTLNRVYHKIYSSGDEIIFDYWGDTTNKKREQQYTGSTLNKTIGYLNDGATEQYEWLNGPTGGSITGDSFTVESGESITVGSISVGTLTIGAGSTLTIAAIPGGPTASGSSQETSDVIGINTNQGNLYGAGGIPVSPQIAGAANNGTIMDGQVHTTG